MAWWLVILVIASIGFLVLMLSISLNGITKGETQEDRQNFFTTFMMHAVILATLLFLIYQACN